MQTEENKGTHLKVVYKKVEDEKEELLLNVLYLKRRREIESLKKDMLKVNEILSNKKKYFKIF
ncbi:MAG TPA: hypothetical protein VNZ45_17845 [Bacteroidia bacterium]|jgi:hypothetical protein|nr:hypothetical protein [Bacteroidia bacterium]